MNFSVYVLFSVKFSQIYVGYSSDVQARIKSHNELATKGWTIRYRPWILIRTETFQTKKEAMIREKQLKSAQGRKWIREMLIPNLYLVGSYPPAGGHKFESCPRY